MTWIQIQYLCVPQVDINQLICKPFLYPDLYNVIDVSSGGNDIFIKTSDNKIYTFPNLEFQDQISHPINIKDVTNNFGSNIWKSKNIRCLQKSARK